MSTQELFHTLQTSAIGEGIGNLNHFFGALAQLVHITGLVLLLTAILVVNLRLLGVGLKKQSISTLVNATNPFVKVGFGLLLVSGIFVFLPSADLYYLNAAFWLKLVLIVFALLIQFTLYKKVTAVEQPSRALAISTAIISLTLWFGVAFVGRAIGFM